MNKYAEKLQVLGLSESEAKVYQVLLTRPFLTASEIAKSTKILRTLTYSILSGLVKKNLCIEHLGGVKKYSAVAPKTVMGNIRSKLQDKILLSDKLAEELDQVYHSNQEIFDPLNFIQVLRTKERIVETIERLEKQTESEVLSFCKTPYAMNVSKLNELNTSQIHSLGQGIHYKCIYEIEKQRLPEFIEMVRFFEAAGEEVRLCEKLPIKMIIFDKKTVVYTLENKIGTDSNLTAMVIQHGDLAKTLEYTFDIFWDQSVTIDQYVSK